MGSTACASCSTLSSWDPTWVCTPSSRILVLRSIRRDRVAGVLGQQAEFRAGVQPTVVGDLPPQLAALNRTFLNVCELTVRAALEGRRDHVHHAALLDPSAAASLSPDAIHAVVEELIDAHGDALPEGIRRGSALDDRDRDALRGQLGHRLG